MYYKKNRSILRSIRNNSNNKAYYILVVVMLAAVCLIAASIILRGYDSSDEDATITEPTTSEVQSESSGEQETLHSIALYRMYIFVDDGVTAYVGTDLAGDIVDIVGAAKCSIGNDVKAYLGDKKQVVLSDILVSSSKSIWTEFDYNNTEYYVQYYSLINGVEFHSALYEENGKYNSIVADSYAAINGYSDNDNDTSYMNNYEDCRGVTLSVASAKAIYENVPGTSDVYICKSFSDSDLYKKELLSGNTYDDINTVVTSTLDAKYLADNRLPVIPEGYSCDPTDGEANYVFSPYRLGSINNVYDKTAEAGQVAYSFIDPDNGSALIRILFNNVTLTDESGADISSFLMSKVDLSGYADAQIAGMNVNGFLLPGDYIVKFYAADMYGGFLENHCYLHVVDTTAPVIALSREITEINQAQIENPDYIREMVTVTDLCKLSDEGIQYELTEEGENVHISFSASDVYGNTGTLEIELRKVD